MLFEWLGLGPFYSTLGRENGPGSAIAVLEEKTIEWAS